MKDTCAACDAPLDDHRRRLTIAGETVEVCCEVCARALMEAQTALGTDWLRRGAII